MELNDELLPTGTLLDVDETPFDFRTGRLIQTGVTSSHPRNQLVGNGYDHPFLLKTNHDAEIVLSDPESGRTLTVETDEAGVAVYSGNSLGEKGEVRGIQLKKHLGICLETQCLPDAVHHSDFPSVILNEGEEYSTVTKYRFGVSLKSFSI